MTTAAKLIARSPGTRGRLMSRAASQIESVLDDLIDHPSGSAADAIDLAITLLSWMVVSMDADGDAAVAKFLTRSERLAHWLEEMRDVPVCLSDAVAEVM